MKECAVHCLGFFSLGLNVTGTVGVMDVLAQDIETRLSITTGLTICSPPVAVAGATDHRRRFVPHHFMGGCKRLDSWTCIVVL